MGHTRVLLPSSSFAPLSVFASSRVIGGRGGRNRRTSRSEKKEAGDTLHLREQLNAVLDAPSLFSLRWANGHGNLTLLRYFLSFVGGIDSNSTVGI
jgi:hypothetical protein